MCTLCTQDQRCLQEKSQSIMHIKGRSWKKTLAKSSQLLQSVVLRLNVPPDLII